METVMALKPRPPAAASKKTAKGADAGQAHWQIVLEELCE
jgi:hypothetical protein